MGIKNPRGLSAPGAVDRGSTMRTRSLYHENICLARGDYSSMGEIYRSLYSVIPARVRDDHSLRPNAKLLYGELSALAQAEGYCWAWNAHLAETLGISKRTVEDLIKQLRDRGHIQLEVERDPDTNEVIRRKIWICGPPGASVPPPTENGGRVPVKSGGPPRENGGENNTRNIKQEYPPYNPPKGEAPARKRKRSNEPKEAPDWKPERFAAFWEAYPCGKSKQAAIRAWDRLRPDEDLIRAMALGLKRAMAGEDWQRGIGIPYASTWLNGRRWEDEDKPLPARAADKPRPARPCHVELIDGEEVVVYDG